MAQSIKVLVADDHPLAREMVVQLCKNEADMQVVGEAGNGQEAVEKALALKPDVIVMDIFMPLLNGVEATAVIGPKLPCSKVLILTVSDRGEDVLQALKLGASGYVLKSIRSNEIVEAVRRTAAGETVISPEMTQRLAAELKKPDKPLTKLSARESQVLELAAEGLTDRQIAVRMSISETTVGTYMTRLLNKMHVKNRAEAIAYMTRYYTRKG